MLSLTPRQLFAFSKKIQSSKVDHYKFLAKLQGHELKTNFEEQGSMLSEAQQEKVDRFLDKMNQRVKRGESVKK